MTSALLSSIHHHLPNELTLLVIDHLSGDNQALCNLARTCRGLQHLAEEQLYKTIELLSVNNLHKIIQAFKCRNERVRAVQTLKILYRHVPEHLEDSLGARIVFNDCVAQMVHLREWHIESPYDNFNWGTGGHEWVEQDMKSFRVVLEKSCVEGPVEEARLMQERRLGNNVHRTVALGLLQSLTIHSHGAHADFWTLDGFHCLFRHPSLRFLHVSCVTFPEDLPELETHVKKTPLTTLEFNECELKPKSLLRILRTPEHLKHLTLGENVFNINTTTRLAPQLTRHANASLEALSAVAHSLETLKHYDPSWRIDPDHRTCRIRPTGDGMRNFHAFKSLECDTGSFLHQAIIMNYELAPPNLDTLRVRRHWSVFPDLFDQLPQVETYLALPSLKTLEFLQSSFLQSPTLSLVRLCDPDSLRSRHAYGYKLYKKGINLKVSIEMHKTQSLIPPYLHGEQVPINQCLYDADLVGFHRHIKNDTEPVVNTRFRPLRELLADNDIEEHFPHAHIAPPEITETQVDDMDTRGNPPETDQLGDGDIQRLNGETYRAMGQLRRMFLIAGTMTFSVSLSDTDETSSSDDSDELDDLIFVATNDDAEWETESEGEDEGEDEGEGEDIDIEDSDGDSANSDGDLQVDNDLD
ncbi:hypothetical protein P153DRAFT_425753 [Dothidotthia symphoricarpi CBS 119687]|uniref:F-box domain-containing protein n=1 Tax=Dothidotthia symphoricarpi CBS 119687 TaxID=1392245 RepID=A0A6A6A404_9PLEO|nr:uncharacterized protein P153DRAFT_425753 [Dothidotthia symphoricarpi CBS 119687]KAF2125321.1 hypothetical protein P153DRAFT_425753 [Dothidotthia symphoricarpi CBS 119687]